MNASQIELGLTGSSQIHCFSSESMWQKILHNRATNGQRKGMNAWRYCTTSHEFAFQLLASGGTFLNDYFS